MLSLLTTTPSSDMQAKVSANEQQLICQCLHGVKHAGY